MNDVAIHFKNAVKFYLDAERPTFDQRTLVARMSERTIQTYFASNLISAGARVLIEGKYHPNNNQLYDVKIRGRERCPDIFVEIKWDAHWTDCFRRLVFNDLQKLTENTPTGAIGVFLAVNISNKFEEFPGSEVCSTVIGNGGVPVRSNTFIQRYWNAEKNKWSLLKMGAKFWHWKYGEYAKSNYNVLVLSCRGVRTKRPYEKSGPHWRGVSDVL